MKKLIKQVVGIDVAHKKIDVCLGRMDVDTETEVYAYRTFNNNEKGFVAFTHWVRKHTQPDVPLRYVMEATGVYHERLAYYLSDTGQSVSIVMPNKITNFFRTLEIKTVTDKSMSFAIASFGLEKKLRDWTAPKKIYRELRQITRERDQIITERTMAKNKLHAEQAGAYPNERTITRIQARIKLLDGQEKEIMAQIKEINKTDVEFKAAVTLLKSIPGIGLLTAATVLSETGGFNLIQSKKQLTSYSGLDVREKESGTSIKGKPRISKRGNKYLRKAMHMPALAALKSNERYKGVFTRIVARTGIKMKAAVAIQRKLLEMCFTIYKSKKPFDDKYYEHQEQATQTEKVRVTT